MTLRKAHILAVVVSASIIGAAYAYVVPTADHVETSVGVSFQSVSVKHHSGAMQTAIFYPAQSSSGSLMGENGVFFGTAVAEDAAPEKGRHPVVLLSHGWGGNYKRMGWLSKGLVDNGAIVIAVNHPNSTTGETGNANALNHWTRSQDLSAALDHALADPVFGPLIDKSRIHVAGFSYGGWTALSMAGARGSHAGIDRFCNDASQAISHCADILRAGITIADIDKGLWEADWRDPRIVSAAAIDPALTWGLTKADVTALDVPLLIIGLGNETDRLHATDTSASGSHFDALVPTATITRITPAAHFTALGICKPEGAEILKSEKDDPVCSDPPGTSRAAVMRQIIDAMVGHFGLKGRTEKPAPSYAD
jgi:predicted dienelactone hydrolase